MKDIIPVSEPLFDETEERLVLDCIRSGWISSEGKYVKQFESECAKYCDMDYGIAVCSGSAALKIAVACLPLQTGDEIIVPTFTIISCVTAIIEAGAVPVLVDCDPETWTMKVEDIEQKISPKTKAIMAVHIYGHPVDMVAIDFIANKYNLYVIEDAAEAHGAECVGRKCGGLSDISILSFYANKIVTTGEGGMVLTNRPNFAEKARSLRNLCFRKEKRFFHTEIGWAFRMTNIQAAIGVAQLSKIEQFVDKKQEMAIKYFYGLRKLNLQLPVEKEWAKNTYWMYGIVIDDSLSIDAIEVIRLLGEKGIQARPFFLGMHQQPVFKDMGLFHNERYPNCDRISRKGLYLPSGQAIMDEQIERVCQSLKEVLKK